MQYSEGSEPMYPILCNPDLDARLCPSEGAGCASCLWGFGSFSCAVLAVLGCLAQGGLDVSLSAGGLTP